MKNSREDLFPLKPRHVAVIGANGQVGAELCLFLKVMGRVEPIGIARSRVGTALLRRLGIECRHGDFSTVEEGRELLKGCSAVVDLALPTGSSPVDTKRNIKQHLTSVFNSLDTIETFMYGSTTSIYRQDPSDPFYRWYGVTKQYAENVATRLGSQSGRKVFNLRLAQVHGEMQSCSMSILDQLYDGAVAHIPDVPSQTVFVFSIAEAVLNIMDGKESPGTYTLTSVPEWSWEDILRWYAGIKGVEIQVQRHPVQLRGAIRETFDFLYGNVQASGVRLINHYRDLASAILAMFSEEFEGRIRFRHALSKASREVARENMKSHWEPFHQRVLIPGKRLSSLSDSRHTMQPYSDEVSKIVHALAAKHEKNAHISVAGLVSP
jgi:nucleoside-diphosphate-sugar epimerase